VAAIGGRADGREDFDFLLGRWQVHNRKLLDVTDPACDEWVEFEAIGEAWPVLGGLGNVDTFHTDALPPGGTAFDGLTLRLFEPGSRTWRLWWTSTRQPGRLDPPLEGRFAGGSALFEGDDVLAGRPVRMQFRWQSQDPVRWQQDFSFDGGTTWRTTWTMTFTRVR
jgi:hypothetical protein